MKTKIVFVLIGLLVNGSNAWSEGAECQMNKPKPICVALNSILKPKIESKVKEKIESLYSSKTLLGENRSAELVQAFMGVNQCEFANFCSEHYDEVRKAVGENAKNTLGVGSDEKTEKANQALIQAYLGYFGLG